ncbi:MAG: lytic transglycosylase domain-containing protein, partial [Rubrivivax sp.]
MTSQPHTQRLARPFGAAWVAVSLTLGSVVALAQPEHQFVLDAREALRKKDAAQLVAATVSARQHPLAQWVEYWELSNRLNTAQADELEAFYARWPGTYVEDRLRNDWLLELGKRRDWVNF